MTCTPGLLLARGWTFETKNVMPLRPTMADGRMAAGVSLGGVLFHGALGDLKGVVDPGEPRSERAPGVSGSTAPWILLVRSAVWMSIFAAASSASA